LGILEKTRALLVSKLGPRIREKSSDERALKDLVLELEKARTDIERGLESLDREASWLEERGEEGDRLENIRADIREGKEELRRVADGLEEARRALETASQEKS